MRRIHRIDDFVRAPVGAFVVGASWLAWCAGPDLGGTVVWGRPSERDADELSRVWEYDRALPGRFDVVSDLSRLAAVEPRSFERLVSYVAGRRDEYDRRVRRHALVRPAGLEGAAVAGFNLLIAPRFEWAAHATAAEAFAWLGRGDGERVRVAVEARATEAAGADLTVSSLRALLARTPQLEAAAAAAALRLPLRTLQRTLAAAGTSFRDEVARARVDVARQLIAATDDKLDAIARRVGLASATQLARLFQRLTGRPPSAFRK